MEIKDLAPEQIEQIKSVQSIEELKSAAAEQGFSVTDEELAFAWTAFHEQDAIEVSDEELENVAGGCGKKGPQEYEVMGCNHPQDYNCNRFNEVNPHRIRAGIPACGNCSHFYPPMGVLWGRWSGRGKCRREFEQ